MGLLHRPYALDCVGLRLRVDQLVVIVAEQDELLGPIPLHQGQWRIAAGAVRPLGHNVGHLAEHNSPIGGTSLGRQDPSAVGQGTAVPRASEKPPLFYLGDRHLLLYLHHSDKLNPQSSGSIISTLSSLRRRPLQPDVVAEIMKLHVFIVTLAMVDMSQYPPLRLGDPFAARGIRPVCPSNGYPRPSRPH